MKYYCSISVYIILINLLIKNSVCFDFIRELLFPRNPILNRVRSLNEARSFDFAILDFIGLVEKHGYPAEEHQVMTEDGYKLIIHRIPSSPKVQSNSTRKAVLLLHGLLANSDTWVLVGPENDLAYMLADEGYDVWIGNVRGNSYCRSHQELSPHDHEFWKFSYHEMAVYDLSAITDYIMELTHQKRIYYIGHSLGTAISYALLSSKPEYNEKFAVVVSFAPIAFWKRPPSLDVVRLLHINTEIIKIFLDNNRIYDLLPQTTISARILKAFCDVGTVTHSTCRVIAHRFGFSLDQQNDTFLSYGLAYMPAGTSVQNLHHLSQNVGKGIFQKYDHGYIDNFKIYGKKKPAVYDVKKISAPLVLFYSHRDGLSLKENIDELAKRVQKVDILEEVPHKSFGHLDFMWGKNAKDLIYKKVIKIMAKY